MTVSSITYAALEASVADRADIVVSATGRHTTAKMLDRITQSLKKWNLLLANAGDDTYLKVQRVTTDPSATIGAEGWAPRQYLLAPDSLLFLRGIDIYPSGSQRPISMIPFDEAGRNNPQIQHNWWLEGNTGLPTFYRQGGVVGTANLIQIHPWADGVYTCDIRYLPGFPPAGASTSYDFILGGEEFVILDAAMKCLVPDGRAGTAEFMAGLREERDRVEADILVNLSRRSNFQRRDSWADRRALQEFGRRWGY